jgi:hypothetical protein
MSIRGYFSSRREEIVAAFGQALLVKLPEGRWELRGGTQDDRTAAKEWISLFCHEAVFKRASSPLCKTT